MNKNKPFPNSKTEYMELGNFEEQRVLLLPTEGNNP
ncbi:hypothetical protein S225a_20900 [Candidatus Brocadiaceae bacterium S225]|nr:hypothetical protein S225a_20900 [Candidatus Brocadiaceae bacterium S225]